MIVISIIENRIMNFIKIFFFVVFIFLNWKRDYNDYEVDWRILNDLGFNNLIVIFNKI